MNIQNPYLPADKQDIDNITTLCEEEEVIYEPEIYEDPDEEALENYIFVGIGVVIMVVSVFAYLYFIN